MKYPAALSLTLTIAALLAATPRAMGANSAPCDDPPGGTITCDDPQAPICRIKGGKVDGHCKTPPPQLNADQLEAWLLSEVIGRPVTPAAARLPENQAILKRQRWESREGVVTFRPPAIRR